MKLTKEDKQLIGKAREIPKRKKVPGGIIREVGCALLTKNDDVFKGVSLHLYCGIALWVDGKKWGIMYPCGRCRELMQQIDEKNRENTWIIVSEKEKVKLKYLLPGEWI